MRQHIRRGMDERYIHQIEQFHVSKEAINATAVWCGCTQALSELSPYVRRTCEVWGLGFYAAIGCRRI